MKKIKLVLKATLFCLAAVLSMGIAQAGPYGPWLNDDAPFGTNGNVILNWSYEMPNLLKIGSGFDTVPYWFSSNPNPPGTPDSGIQGGGPPNAAEASYDGIWDAWTKESDGYHAQQTSSYIIQQGDCFLVSIASKNEFVYTLGWAHTNAYLTVVLYYGGTSNTVVGNANTSLGTVGTPFFTNTFVILPGSSSHTTQLDYTNYFFGVITNVIPTNAIGKLIGIDISQTTTQYNSGAYAQQSWLDFDGVVVVPTNGISPISSPIMISPTNTVFGGETLTFTENAFGSLPLTYQWRTDGGGGGALTNIPPGAGGVTGADTNIMQVVTSTTPGTYKFDLIIANNSGSVTCSVVSITVRGLIAPIITQDTGTADFGPITNLFAFNGGNVNLYAAFDGAPVVTNQWLFNNGTGYAAITTATNFGWTLTNIQAGSVGLYRLGATNATGSSNSTPAHLTALADPGAPTNIGTNMYAYCVMTNNPWAYWKFEETQNTLTNSMQAYDYSGHNFDATYGNYDTGGNGGCLDGGENISLNAQHGPNPNDYLNGYPGMPSTNGCAGLNYNVNNGSLKMPPLNLNTNAVTFTMWIYPNDPLGVIAPNSGLLMNRNGSDGAGVGFSGNQNANLTSALGYTWNSNNAATYGWNSHLFPIAQQWQFVAYVISPQNTTIYLYYVTLGATNLLKAVSPANVGTNGLEAFSGGTSWIGGDNWDNGRTFNGSIDEVAVFNSAMSEVQVQGLFLRALGLTNGVAPVFTQLPANTPIFLGQVLQIPAAAGGIPSPNYQWQFQSGTTWNNAVNSTVTGIFGATNATFGWTNYSGAFTNFRCLAYNAFGTNTSPAVSAFVIPVANWNKGLWTVNFAVPSTSNGGPGTNFVGHGVLGANFYWNVLSGGNFANTPPTLLDDGVTRCIVNLSCTNTGNGTWYNAGSTLLLDEYMNFGTNGTSMVFTDVPNGRYNLAVYMIDAGPQPSYSDRGTTVTVQGASHSITNAQDVALLTDNTVVYTNLLVTNGVLEMHMQPYDTPLHTPNTEGDFNGAQLELLKYGPAILSLTNKSTNFVLTYVGGKLLEATSIMGPWTTNTAVPSGAVTINPTGQVKFYRVLTNTAWE